MSSPDLEQAADGPRAVHRALMMLTCVAERGPQSLTELARALDMSPSTAMRLGRALIHWGYLDRDESGTYSTGRRFASLRRSVPDEPEADIVELSGPVLRALTEDTGESSYLSVRGAAQTLIYLRQVPSPQPIRHVNWTGRSMPMEGTAAGAALLGKTDERGVAVAKAIATEGATAIAAPVRDAHGTIVAALSIVGPSFRMPARTIVSWSEHVRGRSAGLSRLLGYER
ncbi:IclR family transcriptional regulator [Streptomyces sp. S3(2020)]|uniref:IclR family transcriptional regulator n=1 Tax=Streptomyces sp. S3(2020) TaxID=2732044 RepID=UPI001487752F|nr:IclR family transcriptional regulator [Streptomyces sp. S3(2020)]NNN29167.1 IclR family transcriptional regulator [Streptomyces sp. S3(2020)]